MMKKIIIYLLSLSALLALVSCGGSVKDVPDETAGSLSASGSGDISVTETDAPSTSAAADLPWRLSDDGTLTVYENVETELQLPALAPWYSKKEKIKNAVIKSGVTDIGERAFEGCTHLKSITVDEGNGSYLSEDGVLFDKEKTVLICFPAAKKIESYAIPDGVISVAGSAFYSCRSVREVTIPDGVKSIGNSAFFGCDNLRAVSLPESVETVGDWAFLNCSALAGITIPDSVQYVGTGLADGTAFYGDGSNWDNGILYIGNHLISADRSASGELAVRPGTLTVAGMAFSGCSSVTGIKIPDSTALIGGNTFTGCDLLTYIDVDGQNNNYSSADGVLFDKEKTTLLCFPSGKEAGSYTVPDGVTSIADKAFSFCSLGSVILPGGLISIGDDSFYDCESLTGIIVPSGVTSIGARAFYSCVSLTSVTLPQSVGSIGEWAFSECAPELVISCPSGSFPEQYAKDNGIGYSPYPADRPTVLKDSRQL